MPPKIQNFNGLQQEGNAIYSLAVICKFITAVLRKSYPCNPHEVCLDLLLYCKCKIISYYQQTPKEYAPQTFPWFVYDTGK